MNQNCSYDSQSNYFCNYYENFDNEKINEHYTTNRNNEKKKLKVAIPNIKSIYMKHCGPFESDCQLKCGDVEEDGIKGLGVEGRDYIWNKSFIGIGGEGKCLKMIIKEPEKISKEDMKKKGCWPFESNCKNKCGNKFKSKAGEIEVKEKNYDSRIWTKIDGKLNEDYRWYDDWLTGSLGFGEGRCDILPPNEEEIPIPSDGCNEEYPFRTEIEEDNELFCYKRKTCSKNNDEDKECDKILRPKYKLLKEKMECVTKKGEEDLGSADDIGGCALKCYDKREEGCKFFIYNKENKNCKFEKHATDEECMNEMVVQKPEYEKIMEKTECKTSLGEEEMKDVNSLEDCANNCFNRDDCKYFLYGREDSTYKDLCVLEKTANDDECLNKGPEPIKYEKVTSGSSTDNALTQEECKNFGNLEDGSSEKLGLSTNYTDSSMSWGPHNDEAKGCVLIDSDLYWNTSEVAKGECSEERPCIKKVKEVSNYGYIENNNVDLYKIKNLKDNTYGYYQNNDYDLYSVFKHKELPEDDLIMVIEGEEPENEEEFTKGFKEDISSVLGVDKDDVKIDSIS
jgi:hypothetical protein